MKKLVYLFLILCVFTSGNSYSYEKVLVPDSIDKKTKSPWNFFEDFENEEEGRFRTNKFTINNKGAGLKPFEIEEDPDGNTYLAVTVKHGWNSDPKMKKGSETERAEFQVRPKRALGKEVWISFKTRLPEDFTHIDDRVLFFQFKNQFERMKRSPLLGLRYNRDGRRLGIGGETGGVSSQSINQQEKYIHRIGTKYKNKRGNWIVKWKKVRNESKDRNVDGDPVSVTPLGEWSTYKIGIYNVKGKDGFVKVYKDGELMFDYNGVTYDWRGYYTGSHIRFGIYRDSGKQFGIEYPDQTIHFDDLIVVSDEKTLDQILNR